MSETFLVTPIGHVEASITARDAAPRQPDEGAPAATLVLDQRFAPAIAGLAPGHDIVVVTWLHLANRDELVTHPRDDPSRPVQGVFSTRSPDRPNPIGLHTTTVVAVDGTRIEVAHLEAVHGTPILDLKPSLEPPGHR